MNSIMTTEQLGYIFKRLRKDKKLSQAALGERLGLSQERVSAIENSPGKITVDQLLTVLMTLDSELLIKPRQNGDRKTSLSDEPW